MNGPKGKYAWMATVGEKGQIVIPKQAREIFDIKPGDTLILFGDEKRGIAIPPASAVAEYADAIFADEAKDKKRAKTEANDAKGAEQSNGKSNE